MSHKQNAQQPSDLHSLFRSQIVQNYPPAQPVFKFNPPNNAFIE